jgi:hypothetical protein
MRALPFLLACWRAWLQGLDSRHDVFAVTRRIKKLKRRKLENTLKYVVFAPFLLYDAPCVIHQQEMRCPMSGEKVAFEQPIEEGKNGKDERDRSTIAFPYLDLEDSEEIAKAIYNHAGTACSVEQLAGFLNQAARGGGFRTRILSARTFGLIDNPRGQVSLTDLGRRIVDPSQEPAARVTAFLTVQLHKAVYDKYKGNVLPPRAALTREIQGLGVAQSQADRARQVMERSAERAGFFAHGRDRLVEPVIQPGHGDKHKDEEKPKPKHSGGGGDELGYHPFIQGLLQKLPQPEADWPYEARVKWLQTAAHIFDLLYASTGDVAAIDVTMKKL